MKRQVIIDSSDSDDQDANSQGLKEKSDTTSGKELDHIGEDDSASSARTTLLIKPKQFIQELSLTLEQLSGWADEIRYLICSTQQCS